MRHSEPITPDKETLERVRKRFDRDHESVRASTEARSSDRLESLIKIFAKRKADEMEDISEVLGELEKAINRELEESNKLVQQELSLWADNERQQLRRDLDALRARLARIPGERVLEHESIERRYADPIHRTFPVAVTFILPTA